MLYVYIHIIKWIVTSPPCTTLVLDHRPLPGAGHRPSRWRKVWIWISMVLFLSGGELGPLVIPFGLKFRS
jgi:hypothetical protein